MQKTEGQEKYCECLRGKGKLQTTTKYDVIQRLEQVSKGVVQKQAKDK